MGHSKKIIIVDIYGDNREIIVEKIIQLEEFIREVAPMDGGMWGNDNTDIMPRIEEYFQKRNKLRLLSVITLFSFKLVAWIFILAYNYIKTGKGVMQS